MHDTPASPDQTFTRRAFLARGLTLASMTATVPLFVERSAGAMALPDGSPLSSRPGVPEDRVLVVLQLSGGNDGLNTVVPFGADEYYDMRGPLAVAPPAREGGALALDQARGLGLHPSLAGLKDLLDDGFASIMQGVGYPNPNRSHFTSMDIWHTADTSAKGDGWIGRYFDNTCHGAPEPLGAVAIGRTAPRAMIGAAAKPVSFESADLFRWIGTDVNESLAESYRLLTRRGAFDDVAADSQLGFLMRTSLDGQVASDRIRAAVARRPLVNYPRTPLGSQLRIVSAMIRAEMATRVYSVSLGGFDTHANQGPRHAGLLRQLGEALRTFHKDLQAQGNSGRVLTMVFSEFGRRVAPNASGGTDHGTAAPMLFVGDMVRPGVFGDHPSLTNLDQGDLFFQVDFRCIYAAILEDWMGADATTILGRAYRKAKIIRQGQREPASAGA